MALLPGKPLRWPERHVDRRRKVGLLGGHPKSLRDAPWEDPSWEWWAHSSVVRMLPYRPDRLFELHPPHCYQEQAKHGHTNYYEWLKQCGIPVWMQKKYEDIPTAVRYPLEKVQTQWPGRPIRSTSAFMVALALLEGVSEIGLWGIAMASVGEYAEQRPNLERWLATAEERCRVTIPRSSPLSGYGQSLYGYETHSTPEKWEERKAKFEKDKRGTVGTKPFDAARLVMSVSDAEAHAKRREFDPQWRRQEDIGLFGAPIPDSILEKEAREREEAEPRDVTNEVMQSA